jgi:RIO kinase 1
VLDQDIDHQKIVTLQGRASKALAHEMDRESTDDEVKDGGEFAPFYATGLITEVLGALKSGKEAQVWICRADPAKAGASLVAAKVYKPLGTRGFRNAAVYEEGSRILDDRVARAVKTKTSFGRQAEQFVWIDREWQHLQQLYEVGVAVPRPITQDGRVIIMEYCGDEDGPAPQLKDVRLTPDEARSAFKWLLYDIELMLGANIVHGDLSPFNVLWHEGRSFVIDLPQAVDPRFNRQARTLLERDVRNICNYFQRFGVEAARPEPITADLWRRFMRAKL